MMAEQLASTSASGFFEWFDRVSREARGTIVGEIMLAAGFEVFHAGGGCLAWSKCLADPQGWQILICDEGNGLGDTPDETYLIGLYGTDGDQWVTDDTDNLSSALALAAEWQAKPRETMEKGNQQ